MDAPRLFPLVLAISATALAVAGCGSSGKTYTSPSSVTKCALTVGSAGSTIPAAGGTGSVTVTTPRECQWTAAPESEWLSVTSGSTGQGDGVVQFSAAANPDPLVRSGAIVINGQRASVAQAAGECRIVLSPESATFSNNGGAGTVQVRPSSERCTWTAAADQPWITIRSAASGTGSAAVMFDVAATEGPPRTGTLLIGGQPFSVTQSEGCAYGITPTSYSAGGSGGSGQINVTAAPGCPWTAASNADWITVTRGTAGSGAGVVSFSVAPTTGPTRTGTIVAAGRLFTVTQSQGCSYDISPASQSFAAAGGSGSVNITTTAGCSWTASSSAPWVAITAGASGSGSGSVAYSVAPNAGASRSAALTIAGLAFTVTQGESSCSFSISPTDVAIGSDGGSASVAVTAAAACTWTAASNAPWITIASGTTGTGNGSVQLAIAANTGPARTGTVTAAGLTVTITQAALSCTYAVEPALIAMDQNGGKADIRVTAPAGCAWTAASNADWITIASGSSGSGEGVVKIRVSESRETRQGTLTVAGMTVTVTQQPKQED